MTSQRMDWDDAYQQRGAFDGTPPWAIGEPQPELSVLIHTGKFRSDVLDAGCGLAELSLTLAANGHTVVGIDLTPAAITAATAAARARGLSTASFVQADITALTGYDGRFNTVVDSALFHSLPVESLDGYQRSIHRAAAPGANYFVPVFAKGAFPPEADTKPNEVDEDELRTVVSKYWEIDGIRPAYIHANVARIPGMRTVMPSRTKDHKGRTKLPAYLLTAHKSI